MDLSWNRSNFMVGLTQERLKVKVLCLLDPSSNPTTSMCRLLTTWEKFKWQIVTLKKSLLCYMMQNHLLSEHYSFTIWWHQAVLLCVCLCVRVPLNEGISSSPVKSSSGKQASKQMQTWKLETWMFYWANNQEAMWDKSSVFILFVLNSRFSSWMRGLCSWG